MLEPSEGRQRRPTPFGLLLFSFALGLAALAVAGLIGRWNAWADIVNHFAALWLGLSALGLLGVLASARWRHRSTTAALLIFAATVQLILGGPQWFDGFMLAQSRSGSGERSFSVLTFNAWNDTRDRAAVIDRIVASGADIVTVQEALGVEQARSPALAAAYPYRATCDDWWGCEILVLSKRPIRDHHYAAPKPTGSGGPLWAVWVTTSASDGRPVRILSTHFAWPVPPAGHSDQVDRLASLVRAEGKGSLIVTCDCNSSVGSFALLQQDSELQGLTRRTRGIFSWPAIVDGAHWPAPFPFLAIDHLYATPDWKTTGLRRLPRSGSDHYPILVTLARAEPAS